jgi:hypothetical protein
MGRRRSAECQDLWYGRNGSQVETFSATSQDITSIECLDNEFLANRVMVRGIL